MQPFLKSLLVTAVLIGLSRPAGAVRVTNLDTVPHTVIYDAAGSRTTTTIAPDDTVDLIGAPNGTLSLQTMKPKVARSTVQADGLLSGIIGTARDQNIPTGSEDEFAIWPDGQLLLQHHRTDQFRH